RGQAHAGAAAGGDTRDARGDRGDVDSDREQDPARADHQAARVVARRIATVVARARPRALRAGPPMSFKIGTRGSPLALVQAESVAAPLRAFGADVEIVPVRTEGDRRLE